MESSAPTQTGMYIYTWLFWVSNKFQAKLSVSLTVYKLELVDNVGNKKKDIVKENACWVKDLCHYKELSKADKNFFDSEKDEKNGIEE